MAITNGYCTKDQVRTGLAYASADTGDDAMIELCIEAAARQIDGHCDRRFWQDGSAVAREFYADTYGCVQVDDISTVTGLIVKTDSAADGTFGTTLTIATDFIVSPVNAGDMVPVEPYTEIVAVGSYGFPILSNGRPGVQVTAKFGWPAVPDNVEQANVVQAIQLFKAKDAAFGVATFGDLGGGLRVQAGLNPIAKALVAKYAKPAVG